MHSEVQSEATNTKELVYNFQEEKCVSLLSCTPPLILKWHQSHYVTLKHKHLNN